MAEHDAGDGRWGWAPPPAAPIPWGEPDAAAGPPPAPPTPAPGPYAPGPYGPPFGPTGAGPYAPPPRSPWDPPPGSPPPGPPRRSSGLAIALAAIGGGVLLFIGLIVAVTFLGRSAERKFEPVGTPIQGTAGASAAPGAFEAEEVRGEGDPTTFATVMPSADEVLETMGPAEHLALRLRVLDRPGPVNNQCTDISANAVASDVQIWVDDNPGGASWEFQAAVFDYGTAQEARRVVTSRDSETFLACIPEAAGQASVLFESPAGKMLEHTEDPGSGAAGPSQSVVLRGFWLTGCSKDEGRMALVWRQVGQYVISAKAFGCGPIDVDTVDPVLDAMAERLP